MEKTDKEVDFSSWISILSRYTSEGTLRGIAAELGISPRTAERVMMDGLCVLGRNIAINYGYSLNDRFYWEQAYIKKSFCRELDEAVYERRWSEKESVYWERVLTETCMSVSSRFVERVMNKFFWVPYITSGKNEVVFYLSDRPSDIAARYRGFEADMKYFKDVYAVKKQIETCRKPRFDFPRKDDSDQVIFAINDACFGWYLTNDLDSTHPEYTACDAVFTYSEKEE